MKKSRFLSLVMASVMGVSLMLANRNVVKAEDSAVKRDSDFYSGEGYTVDFCINSKWSSGYNATITITNNGTDKIENWKMLLPMKNKISNIWNASKIDNNEGYIIKNTGWNQDIPVGGSVSFGFTSCEGFAGFPDYYSIIDEKVNTRKEDYDVEYSTESLWKGGLVGKIKISNNRDDSIEDWRLSFTYDGDITEIWNAKILSHIGNVYVISGKDYNQNICKDVFVGFKVSMNGDIGNPSDFYLEEYNSGKSNNSSVYLMGLYDELKSKIDLYYTSSEEMDGYYIYYSMDGDNYDLFAYEEEKNTISFDCTGKDMYLYVEGEKEGRKKKSEIVSVRTKEGGMEIINPDEDEEGLCDYLEYSLKTNMKKKDTDGDGVDDYYEMAYMLTDPLKQDTDDNGITDADEDLDGDGLTNIEEFEYGTYGYDVDTDGDGLSDYEEIYSYKTNPLIADTDGDGLNDGDEVEIKFDPLSKDSDFDGTDDSDEYIFQHAEYDIVEDEKPLFTKVSVDASCKGNINSNIEFYNMYDFDVMAANVVGALSVPMEIKLDTEFEKATINFEYDETRLGQTKEENLVMLWYDAVNDNYVMLDSVVNTETNVVSYETNHFSMYLVVDKEIWLDCWREDINYRSKDVSTYYDIVFVTDVSGSMRGSNIDIAKQTLKSFMNGLYFEDRYGVVTFESTSKVLIPLGNMYNDLAYKNSLNDIIDRITAYGGTNANSGVVQAIDMLQNDVGNEKVIILICDGDINITDGTVKNAVDSDIVINCVNVEYSNAKRMEDIAYATGGTYYYAATSEDLKDKLESIFHATVDSVDITDSDGDGLYDVYEMNGMKLSNGQVVYCNPNCKDTDKDGISDYDELGGLPGTTKVYVGTDLYSCTIFHGKRNPVLEDTDGDGNPDILDKTPTVADRITIAELASPSYLAVEDEAGNMSYGGSQSWWKDDFKDSQICNYGCGLIAMADMELYFTLNKPRFGAYKSEVEVEKGMVKNDYYEDMVETYGCNFLNETDEDGDGKFDIIYACYSAREYYDIKKDFFEVFRYKLLNLPFEALDQVFPRRMESGLKEFFKDNGYSAEVKWASSLNRNVVHNTIIEMLSNDIPVTCAYFSFYALGLNVNWFSLGKRMNTLPLYNCDTLVQESEVSSHYMNITGMYYLYDDSDNSYKVVYQVSSWGGKYYFFEDDYMEKLSGFSNIIDIHLDGIDE